MNLRLAGLGWTMLACASFWAIAGCGGGTGTTKASTTSDKKHAEETTSHKEKDTKHAEHTGHKKHAEHTGKDHHDKPLTVKDIKIPDTFKNGVARLEELNNKIHHLIEHNELPKVHRVAEEMALVAGEMKKMAKKEIAQDHQAEVGSLCNEVAALYKAIDETADAGKKKETEENYNKLKTVVGKLKAHAK